MPYMRSLKPFIAALLVAGTVVPSYGQVVRKRDKKDKDDEATPGVTFRMKEFYEKEPESDANLMWMRIIYRQIDLTKPENMPLYFPEEPTEDQQSLFRIIMKLVTSNQVPAYEYLDGRELFTDQYKINVQEMLDRFHILYTEAKGSTEKNPKFTIEESDVPSNEVLSYYVIERWEFSTTENRTKTRIEAICPVLHRVGDFGGEPIRYPMFWIKLDALRPYLTQQSIFIDDDNNLARYTYDDFFQLGMYKGEIYKTRNLRNQSLMQMFPDPDALKHAQDSIENRLNSFDKNIWVPTREELAARAEAEEEARLLAEGKSDDIEVTEREDNEEQQDSKARNKRSVRSRQRADKESEKQVKEEKQEKEEKKSKKKKKSKVKGSTVNSKSGNVSRSVRRTR